MLLRGRKVNMRGAKVMDADKQPSHLFFLVTKSFESEKNNNGCGLWDYGRSFSILAASSHSNSITAVFTQRDEQSDNHM